MIDLRSANYATGDTSSALSCNAPAGVAAADVLLGLVTTGQDSGGATNITASGWTTAAFWNNGGDSQLPASAVLWKAAGGSEPGSYSFSKAGTSANDQMIIHLMAFPGVDIGNPFAIAPTKLDMTSGQSRNPVPAPSLTVPPGLAEQAMLVTAHIAMSWYGSAGTDRWSLPTDMTEVLDQSGPWTQMGTFRQLVDAGASGTRNSSLSQAPNQQGRGIALALRPTAPAAPTGPEPGRMLLAGM